MLINFVELFLLQLLNDISRDQEFSTPFLGSVKFNQTYNGKLSTYSTHFINKVPLATSKCLSKWIKVDKWDYFKNSPQDFFFLFSLLIYCFKYEVIVRSSAWSFGHKDPDPSSAHS